MPKVQITLISTFSLLLLHFSSSLPLPLSSHLLQPPYNFKERPVRVSTEPKLEIIYGPEFVMDNDVINLTVKWKDVHYKAEDDFIGVFACEDEDCKAPVVFYKNPVQYKFAESKEGNAQKETNKYDGINDVAKYFGLDYLWNVDKRERLRGDAYVRRLGKKQDKHTARFSILVRPDVPAYILAYVTGSRQYPEVAAISVPVKIPKEILYKPRFPRLSLVSGISSKVHDYLKNKDDDISLRIIYTESTENSVRGEEPLMNSYILYGGEESQTDVKRDPIEALPIRKYNFEADNLCEKDLYPAATVGFIPLGTQVEVILGKLAPRTKYWYSIRYFVNGRAYETEKFTFNTYDTDEERTKFVVFGDMGQSMSLLDGSLQHSFDNRNHGELGAPQTAMLLKWLVETSMEGTKSIDVINHIGDISYATGQLALWHSFLFEISSSQSNQLASKVPWMTAIGNHEIGFADSDIPGSDSQGECGVPYMSLFSFAQKQQSDNTGKLSLVSSFAMTQQQSEDYNMPLIEPYYSYMMKKVFVLVISTEHHLNPGSQQYEFIITQLSKAKRLKDVKEIHWIVLLGHRPMYISDVYKDPGTTHLLRYIEPLLRQFSVDVAFWGHHHSYQRFKCAMYKNKCDQDGTWHILSGAGGYDFSPMSDNKVLDELFAFRENKHWGVATIDFVNSSHANVQFIENKNFETLDEFWIVKQ